MNLCLTIRILKQWKLMVKFFCSRFHQFNSIILYITNIECDRSRIMQKKKEKNRDGYCTESRNTSIERSETWKFFFQTVIYFQERKYTLLGNPSTSFNKIIYRLDVFARMDGFIDRIKWIIHLKLEFNEITASWVRK